MALEIFERVAEMMVSTTRAIRGPVTDAVQEEWPDTPPVVVDGKSGQPRRKVNLSSEWGNRMPVEEG